MKRERPPFALAYQSESYRNDLFGTFGRRVANQNLLEALRSSYKEMLLYGNAQELRSQFAFPSQGAKGGITIVDELRPTQLLEVGALFWPSPGIARQAQRRSHFNPKGWSLIGLTHSLPERSVIEAIEAFLTTPVREFDALICTSHAVRDVVEAILDNRENQLRTEVGATHFSRPKLPVIPLGVDTARFANRDERRAQARSHLGFDDTKFVVLSLGRIDTRAKGNPIGLLAAAQRAAIPALKLILAGASANGEEVDKVRRLATLWAPEVDLEIIENPSEEDKISVLHASDVFASLIDNFQESFGLSVIEAMSAGLPSIVSDWSGYRDTIRHGRDGIRIPTLIPSAELGTQLGQLYQSGLLKIEDYLGFSSDRTIVDVAAASQALRHFYLNPEDRRAMGATAARRAQTDYDLDTMVKRYVALCQDLQDLRLSASEKGWDPKVESPFYRFRSFATSTMKQESVLALAVDGPGRPDALLKDDRYEIIRHEVSQILHVLTQNGPLSFSQIFGLLFDSEKGRLTFAAGIMAKHGLITIAMERPRDLFV